jgi:hypothetical protein
MVSVTPFARAVSSIARALRVSTLNGFSQSTLTLQPKK